MPNTAPKNEENPVTTEVLPVSAARRKPMGKTKEEQPEKLPEKLLEIRHYFTFTQEEMVPYILPKAENATAARAALSDFENGRRTPSIIKLYNYAVAVRLLTRYKSFSMEDLVRDDKDLPWKKR